MCTSHICSSTLSSWHDMRQDLNGLEARNEESILILPKMLAVKFELPDVKTVVI